jgi:hypothetical protein
MTDFITPFSYEHISVYAAEWKGREKENHGRDGS